MGFLRIYAVWLSGGGLVASNFLTRFIPTRVYGWRITNKYYLVTRYLLVGTWDSRFSGLSVFMSKKVKIVEQITGFGSQSYKPLPQKRS